MSSAPSPEAPSSPCEDPYLPRAVEVVERITEGPRVTTLRLRFTDPTRASYDFAPGQFNMLHGPDGDVPISIVAGNGCGYFEHSIRSVGNASRELASCRKGDLIGLRGPFGGGGWPLAAMQNRDVVIVSGGIGCAAVASAIDYIVAHRERYGHLSILQGVTSNADHLYDERYERWSREPRTQVLLASMEGGDGWKGHKGLVTELLADIHELQPDTTTALICGPEVMVRPVVDRLLSLGLSRDDIHVSFERNMQCGVGHCTHCQLGSRLVCRDGPVFRWAEIEPILKHAP